MFGQAVEVVLQVLLDLALGLGQETEIDTISEARGDQAEPEGSGVPQRVEQALAPAQFLDALLGPGQMLGLLVGSLHQRLTDAVVARQQRLPLIQGLGTDLAAMVDSHQRGGVPALLGAEFPFRDLGAGRRPQTDGYAEKCSQAPVELDDELVDHGYREKLGGDEARSARSAAARSSTLLGPSHRYSRASAARCRFGPPSSMRRHCGSATVIQRPSR